MNSRTGRWTSFGVCVLGMCVFSGCGGGGTTACASSASCPDGTRCVSGVCADVEADGSPTPDARPTECDACGGQCCAAEELCRYGGCRADRPCESGDDCDEDAYCDDDGQCTPWGVPEFKINDPTCARLVGGPERFIGAIQCAFRQAPAGDPVPDLIDARATPIVVDLDLDLDPSTRRPSIVWVANRARSGGGIVAGPPVLRVIDGATCESQLVVSDPMLRLAGGSPAAADLDGDGRPEIVAVHEQGGLVAFRYSPESASLELFWRTEERLPAGLATGPSLVDLDDDGRPEIVAGGLVFDAAGNALITDEGASVFSWTDSFGVVADVDLDGRPEYVRADGTFAYEPGAWVPEPYSTGEPGLPGFVAIADFGDFPDAAGDGPGRPEVVVAGGGEVRVQSIGGDTVAGPFALPGGDSRGGPPTIADFDGDGRPEIGVADSSGYSVHALDGIAWGQASQDASSGSTGSSVFDFEADGRAEVVYADECYLRIYDGSDGTVLYSYSRTSCTWRENPIVVDADGDRRSEIVVPLDDTCTISCPAVDPIFDGLRCDGDDDCPSGAACAAGRCGCTSDDDCGPLHGCREGVCTAVALPRRGGIEVLRDPGDRWAPSRPIWNQHAYAVTNIGDDGVVPRSSEARRNWEVPGLNNFRQNVQGGFDPLAAADLTAGEGSFGLDCSADVPDMALEADICNRGAFDAPAALPVAFVRESSGERVCTATTEAPLAPGSCTRVRCVWEDVPQRTPETLLVVPDPDRTVGQCLAENDFARIVDAVCPFLR